MGKTAKRELTDRFLSRKDTRGNDAGPSKEALGPFEDDPDLAQTVHWDARSKGLGVRVTRKGARSFFIWYRFKGSPRRDTLRPTYPALSLDDARLEAALTAADVKAGRDPRLSGRAPRAHYLPKPEETAEPAKPETYAEAVESYIKRHQEGTAGNKTAREVKRALLRAGGYRSDPKTKEPIEPEWPHWADRPLRDITARDVREVLEAIRDGREGSKPAGYMANRTFAYMRTFFSWCAEPGIEKVEKSPLDGLKRPWDGEEARDRWYEDEEIAAIWRAADALPEHQGALLKVLVLTGKRKSAIATMRHDQIADDGLWTPPQDRRRKRGNKRTHAIPLPPLALRIIRGVKQVNGNPYVFPGKKLGEHLRPGSRLQRTIQEKSGVADFEYHALRHTAETRLGSLGILPHVRDMLLDHAPARGAGAGYDHHAYRDEMADALKAWEDRVAAVLRAEGVWSANVEPLRG